MRYFARAITFLSLVSGAGCGPNVSTEGGGASHTSGGSDAGAGGSVAGDGGAGNGGYGGMGIVGGAGGGQSELCPTTDPVEGAPCSQEGQTCGGENCEPKCEFCNIIRCEAGNWTHLEIFPDPECNIGETCTDDSDCGGGTLCCYPCGIPDCTNECMLPADDGGCPLFP